MTKDKTRDQTFEGVHLAHVSRKKDGMDGADHLISKVTNLNLERHLM